MKDSYKCRGSRIEEKIRANPGIYRLWIWNEEKKKYDDPRYVPGCKQKPYRARRYVKILGKKETQSGCFDSLEEARAWKNSKPSEEAKPKDSSYIMKDLISEWQTLHRPPHITESSWEMYAKDVGHLEFLWDVPVSELSASDIDKWLDHVKSPKYPKNSTRVSFERELKTFRTLLNWYRDFKNPDYRAPILKRHRKYCFFQAKIQKNDRALRWEELEKFLERLRIHHRPVYHYLASFQALVGARVGEACGLKWEDIDFQKQTVMIQRTVWWDHKRRLPHLKPMTKTGEPRRVVLCPRALQDLREWKLKSGKFDFVFTDKGNLIRYRSIQSAYNKAFKMLGFPHRSTHVLRHTFATLYAEQTRNRIATQAVLGHKSSAMTDRYAKPTEQAQWDSMGDFLVGRKRPERKKLQLVQ